MQYDQNEYHGQYSGDNRNLLKRMIGKSYKRDKVSYNRKVHMKHRAYEKSLRCAQKRQSEKRLIALNLKHLEIIQYSTSDPIFNILLKQNGRHCW